MVNSFARGWATVLNKGWRSLTFSPRMAWRERMLDLEALAGFLLQIEMQLDRARIDCQCSVMTMDQPSLLKHYKVQQVQQTPHEAALHATLPDCWLAQQVLDAIDAWNVD